MYWEYSLALSNTSYRNDVEFSRFPHLMMMILRKERREKRTSYSQTMQMVNKTYDTVNELFPWHIVSPKNVHPLLGWFLLLLNRCGKAMWNFQASSQDGHENRTRYRNIWTILASTKTRGTEPAKNPELPTREWCKRWSKRVVSVEMWIRHASLVSLSVYTCVRQERIDKMLELSTHDHDWWCKWWPNLCLLSVWAFLYTNRRRSSTRLGIYLYSGEQIVLQNESDRAPKSNECYAYAWWLFHEISQPKSSGFPLKWHLCFLQVSQIVSNCH